MVETGGNVVTESFIIGEVLAVLGDTVVGSELDLAKEDSTSTITERALDIFQSSAQARKGANYIIALYCRDLEVSAGSRVRDLVSSARML